MPKNNRTVDVDSFCIMEIFLASGSLTPESICQKYLETCNKAVSVKRVKAVLDSLVKRGDVKKTCRKGVERYRYIIYGMNKK